MMGGSRGNGGSQQEAKKVKKNREIKRESPVGNNLSPRTNNDQTGAGLREKDGER